MVLDKGHDNAVAQIKPERETSQRVTDESMIGHFAQTRVTVLHMYGDERDGRYLNDLRTIARFGY